MSHELDDNKERRRHILAKIRQHQNGISLTKLTTLIMDEGYNLRGARDKVKELSFMGLIKEIDLLWFCSDTLTHTRTEKKKGKVQEVEKKYVEEKDKDTRQEES